MMLQSPRSYIAKRLVRYLEHDPRFRKVYHAVQRDFIRANLGGHNWEHVYRDICNAIVIGEAEKADMAVVLPAITMHDIGFLYGGTGKTHGEVGAKNLPRYLKKIRVSYPREAMKHIAACIRTHKGSMFDLHPESLEAKVVADADLLEKFGPIGVYQHIRTWVEFGSGIEHVIERKDKIRTLTLETKTGRELAARGRAFVKQFFHALDRAYEPYRL